MSNTFDQFDNPFDQFDAEDTSNTFDRFDKEKKKGSAKGLVQRFNKGLVDFINFPTNLLNTGLKVAGAGAEAVGEYTKDDPNVQASLLAEFGIKDGKHALTGDPVGRDGPAIPGTRSLEEGAHKLGLTPHPDDPAEGIGEHAMEIMGASAAPFGALLSRGNQVLNYTTKQLQQIGVVDHLAASTAARPGFAAAGEVAASFGAATGRHVATENEAGTAVTVMAELLGGLTPAAVLGIAGNVSLLRVLSTQIKKHLAPFTEAGAAPRASERLKSLAADPKASAERIDVDSPVPPAVQAGDDGLLALERRILDDNPALRAEFDEALNTARQQLKADALRFGGNKGRARELLAKGKEYLLSLVDLRAAKAAKDLDTALGNLDPMASPRDINLTVRQVLDGAYADARLDEKRLWDAIDSKAPVDLKNGRETFSEVIAARSKFDDPEDIPAWLSRALGDEEIPKELLGQLKKAGVVAENGSLLPGAREALEAQGVLQPRNFTFKDARAIRTRILDDIRAERAKDAPNRNKIRILNRIANGDGEAKGILDDIGDSGIPGTQTAREFSAKLNQRFTQGRVGRLLGFERTGGQSVTPKETLDYLLTGRDPTATINQMVEASPSTRPLIESYLRSEFLGQTMTDAGINRRAAERFIQSWERRGAFEVFPGLQDELRSVKNLADGAKRLGVRADTVRTFANSSGKSRAALYLDSDPGDEMRTLLNSKRPMAVARSVVARVKGDQEALRGLRTSFVEEGFRRSRTLREDGTETYSGKRMQEFLASNRRVAKQLGMSDADLARLDDIAGRFRKLDKGLPTPESRILDDMPSAIMDLAARWIGARTGGKSAQTLGSSLVMAQAFSQRMRNALKRLTLNKAEQMLIAAHSDPALYRALLVRPDASVARQDKAAATVSAWLAGVGATELD